jgi:hypothetical protein
MSTAKFERLIDLIINEDQERAEQLFHEIVVEKSRQIYEGLMDEEMCDEDMTTGLMDEIEMEETSDMTMEDEMEDEEMSGDFDVEADDESMDGEDDMEMDGEDDMEMSDEEDFVDADMGSEGPASKSDVMDLEDKLDQLLAAFEEEFGSAEEEEGEEEEEEGEEEEEEGEEEEEESGVMEAVEMKRVSVTHTDGADSGSKRGPIASNSGARGMASKPVKFSDGGESVPTSPKAPSNYGAKGQGSLPGAGSFQNAPGGAKGVKGGKGEAAAKPVKTQASGVNTRDVVPESRRIKKKIIR